MTPRGNPWRSRATSLLPALLGVPLLAGFLAAALVVHPTCVPADAIAVLAGGGAYVERTAGAAAMMRRGLGREVLLTDDGVESGWSQAEQRNPRFVERAAAALRADGVPASEIHIVPGVVSGGTWEEAVRLRAYAESRGLRSLVLATSPYHSRRADWVYRHVFRGSTTRVQVCPVVPGADTPGALTWWLTPAGWRAVGAEYAKFAYYLVRHG